jgi:hypothetical protein
MDEAEQSLASSGWLLERQAMQQSRTDRRSLLNRNAGGSNAGPGRGCCSARQRRTDGRWQRRRSHPAPDSKLTCSSGGAGISCPAPAPLVRAEGAPQRHRPRRSNGARPARVAGSGVAECGADRLAGTIAALHNAHFPRDGAGHGLLDEGGTVYRMVRRPAVAGITGGCRAWTVSMISELSIPCG